MQRVVNEFYSVCKRRKLKVNAGKSKVMGCERREVEVVDFNTAYRVRLPAVAGGRGMGVAINCCWDLHQFWHGGSALSRERFRLCGFVVGVAGGRGWACQF